MKYTSNRLFCLLGDKVDNSLSPVIHNSFFNYYDISGFYIPLNVSQSNLEDIVLLLNKLNFQGANVTIPHKENIIKFLDVLDPVAEQIHAVNTILRKNDKLIGYNTDIGGFLEPLDRKISSLNNKKILILGAGGVAKAVFHALITKNCKEIVILNRTVENIKKLFHNDDSSTKLSYDVLTQQNLDALFDVDVIINTIPLSRTGTNFEFNNLKSDISLAYDLEYIPKETNFIKKMKMLDAEIVYGYEMLLSQAKLSFQIWNDVMPDENIIHDKILSLLSD